MYTPAVGQLRTLFLRTPEYPRLHISVNDVSQAQHKLNGISRKDPHKIVKSNEN